MPVSDNAAIEVTGYNWVPDFAKGQVRDLRVRWALEEIGLPYKMRLMHPAKPRPEGYVREQPFEQVPVYHENGVHLFESGAILVHIGEKDERLLPRDAQGKGRAIGWVFAALNSVEPALQNLAMIAFFNKDEEWAKLRRQGAEDFARLKLKRISDWLGDKPWLEDRFTIGDIMMACVLRIVEPMGLVDTFPNLRAYLDRLVARPAFKAALDAQLADFTAAAPELVPA
ncbi:glutathione S-transferase family protein [Rhizorhapis sp. SPR117]|uniref:glutathione S-transferase family protein n=1 Tax=Rhizorhapis sp. SPR117 TaxID=2912611 RepID=UPI001F3295F0|nr:glutathione S-transferase family protein [Rhizorhapis sp. SPR117]